MKLKYEFSIFESRILNQLSRALANPNTFLNHIYAPSPNPNGSVKHVSAPFYGKVNVVSAPFNIFARQNKRQ